MSASHKDVHTAESSGDQEWTFDVPPLNIRGAKMQLLTIGRIAVYGQWYGRLGQHFVAYAPLLKIPKDIPSHVFNGPRKESEDCEDDE